MPAAKKIAAKKISVKKSAVPAALPAALTAPAKRTTAKVSAAPVASGIKVVMDHVRDTNSTHVYASSADDAAVTKVYIVKGKGLPAQPPAQITLTIAY